MFPASWLVWKAEPMFTCHVCRRQMGGLSEGLLISLLSLFDGLIWVPLCRQRGFCSEWSHWHQLPCRWSETICSRRILNALQQWRVWHGLNRAYVASIDFHIWEHLYYCWSPIRAQQAAGAQLEQLAHWQAACIVGEELCRLFRETSQWLRLYIIL